MSKKVIVFAGTNEGREICEYLCRNHIDTTACVATEYGTFCLEDIEGLEICEGRLAEEEIQMLIAGYDYVVDASHPYAQIISANIEVAIQSYMDRTDIQDDTMVEKNSGNDKKNHNIKKICIVRESQERKGQLFQDVKSVCAYLNTVEGKVLLTTGSKDLHYYTDVNDYQNRIYPRVLPSIDSLEHALNLGFKPSNIICMQGPFSVEMNIAMIRKIDAKYMVSKDTGKSGGFDEKLQAAELTGATLLTIGRPYEEIGYTIQEAKTYFLQELKLREA